MRYAIFGAGAYGIRLRCELEKSGSIVSLYIDNYKRDSIDNIPIVGVLESTYWMRQGYFEKVIIAISDYYLLGDFIFQLHEMGYSDVIVADPRLWKDYWNNGTDHDLFEFMYELDINSKAVITKLEYHVCDHCNLNCAGCAHFAPLFNESYSDLEKFKSDLERMTKQFSNILRLRLMGGEPFLHEKITDFVKIARGCYPYANLEIVTNGLMIPNIDTEVWKIIRENNAQLNISYYKPTFLVKEKIEEVLRKNGVRYSFGSGLEQFNEQGIIEEFHTSLTLRNDFNGIISVKKCPGNRCHYLREGKISKCAFPLLIDKFNETFGTEYTVDKNDYVDLYEDNNPWEMVRKLYYATPFCNYCSSEGVKRYKWEINRKLCLEDYLRE
jgi:hypothetical protein